MRKLFLLQIYVHAFPGSLSVGAFLTKYCLTPLVGPDAGMVNRNADPIIDAKELDADEPVA